MRPMVTVWRCECGARATLAHDGEGWTVVEHRVGERLDDHPCIGTEHIRPWTGTDEERADIERRAGMLWA